MRWTNDSSSLKTVLSSWSNKPLRWWWPKSKIWGEDKSWKEALQLEFSCPCPSSKRFSGSCSSMEWSIDIPVSSGEGSAVGSISIFISLRLVVSMITSCCTQKWLIHQNPSSRRDTHCQSYFCQISMGAFIACRKQFVPLKIGRHTYYTHDIWPIEWERFSNFMQDCRSSLAAAKKLAKQHILGNSK